MTHTVRPTKQTKNVDVNREMQLKALEQAYMWTLSWVIDYFEMEMNIIPNFMAVILMVV